MTPPYSGQCLCGAARFTCTAAPLWQAHCHCQSCRKATASAFASFFGVANGAWSWVGQVPLSYASSPGVWRDFCGNCGSQLAYRSTRFPGEMHFYAALLDDPASYAPTEHVHTSEQLPWLHLSDGLPRR